MSTSELQKLKIAWLAAKEAGDTQEQIRLLHEYPEQQDSLIDFIAGYHATASVADESGDATLALLTRRALNTALDRAFPSPVPLSAANLTGLRQQRRMKKEDVARGLRLSVQVWQLFENGSILLASLSARQLERIAQFFQVSTEQFGSLLTNSQLSLSTLRRQTREAARSSQQVQRQNFADVLKRSAMPKEDKDFWLEE